MPPAPPALGVDIVAIARVARLLARHPARFAARAFHPLERARAAALPAPRAAAFLAARWAAKEALHKALGGRARLDFAELEVAAGARGAPAFVFHGAARAGADGARLAATVSLSHEADYAVAVVAAAAEGGDDGA